MSLDPPSATSLRPSPGPPPPRRPTFLGHVAVGLAAAALLWAVVPFGPFPPGVPFHYQGEGLLRAALVKEVAQDGPFHFSRIGAPFGSDVVDWPFGMWLPLLLTSALVRATASPGLALNLLWLAATVLSAVSASWALGRLGHGRAVASVFGLAFAFLPYGFYANVDHPELAFPLVPLLALAALRACGGAAATAGERRATLAACAAQGLCAVEYSFFAAWLLLAGTALGWLRTKRRDLLRTGGLGLALLALGAAVPILPTALYWSRHGRNEVLSYKLAARADLEGLRLREMLLPIDEHPLPAMRLLAARVEQAAFPGRDDDLRPRLGTLATVGLLTLLAFALARAAGVAQPDEALGAAAALTVAGLLLAQVGGLGSVFDALVVADVHAYDRIVVFVAFFGLHAAASAASRLLAPVAALPRARVLGAALAGAAVAGIVADQVPRHYLARARWSTAPAFETDAAFVARLESLLPKDAMVFQLPHAAIPLDPGRHRPLAVHEQARGYLHSRTLRWSWGSLPGRNGDWQEHTSGLPPPAMVRRLALAGFAGIWIDRSAYPAASAGGAPGIETALAAAAGADAVVSSDGHFSFLDLRTVRRRLAAELGPRAFRPATPDESPLVPRWGEGCSAEQGTVEDPSRVCGRRAWVELENRGGRVRLAVSARLHALRPGRLRLRGDGFEDVVALAGETLPYRRELELAPRASSRIDIAFDGPCEATSPRPRCVEVFDLKAGPVPPGPPGAP